MKRERDTLGHALRLGYEIDLHSDGNATVTNPKGVVYTVADFDCDCPASRFGKKPCKHAHYVSQIYICPECSEWAVLVDVHMPTGDVLKQFQCPNRHIYSFEEVKEIRRV